MSSAISRRRSEDGRYLSANEPSQPIAVNIQQFCQRLFVACHGSGYQIPLHVFIKHRHAAVTKRNLDRNYRTGTTELISLWRGLLFPHPVTRIPWRSSHDSAKPKTNWQRGAILRDFCEDGSSILVVIPADRGSSPATQTGTPLLCRPGPVSSSLPLLRIYLFFAQGNCSC